MSKEVQQYIDNVSRFWTEQPAENVMQYADYLMRQFTADFQTTLFVSGMIRMAIVNDNSVYKQIATSCFKSATAQGIDSLSLLTIKLPPEDGGKSLEISIKKASKVSEAQRAQGKIVGLLHGHYRLLTPGNLANIVLAGSECDVLLLGIERGRRTAKYKGVEPVYRDWERGVMVLSSGLADYLVWISRLEYSNDGYRRMVRQIKPNVYFGNAGNPDWLRKEMQFRADSVGAAYHEIKKIESFSSTDFSQRNIVVPSL